MKPVLWLRKSAGAILVLMELALPMAWITAGRTLVHIRASPERDVVPSKVSLRVSTDMVPEVEMIAWDYDGDGRFDAEGPQLHSQTVTFSHAGHYSPRVIVTNKQGQTFEATADVVVENPEDLEAALNARWRGMLAALAKENVAGAVSFVATRKRDAMRQDWIVLADHLGDIAHLFSVPLQLTDGQGFRAVAKLADSLPMGEIQFPLEVEFVWESDHQWYIKNF